MSRDLVAESAAYLQGAVWKRLREKGHPVPAWAWLNALAHSDAAGLREVAGLASTSESPDSLVRDLAERLLYRMEEHAADLGDLQRTTLIPLELALLELPNGRAAPECAGDLAEAITAAGRAGLRHLR